MTTPGSVANGAVEKFVWRLGRRIGLVSFARPKSRILIVDPRCRRFRALPGLRLPRIRGGLRRLSLTRRRALEWRIAAVNLLGCIAFGISAIAAFWAPSSGTVVDLAVANVFTVFGGLCFLVGAILLLPELPGHARAAAPA